MIANSVKNILVAASMVRTLTTFAELYVENEKAKTLRGANILRTTSQTHSVSRPSGFEVTKRIGLDRSRSRTISA
jgi:hypothetical protein